MDELAERAFLEFTETGELGESCIALMHRLVQGLVWRRGFPPPEGHQSWTPDAFNEALSQVFALRPGLTLKLFVQADDHAALVRLLRTAISNAIVDLGRGTPIGRMVRRLRTILGKVSDFVLLAAPEFQPGWALADGPTHRCSTSRENLLRSAHDVAGDVPYLNAAGRTRKSTRDLFVAVARAVLSDADGSVSESDMATVVVDRFDLRSEPRIADEPELYEGDLDAGEAAIELFDSLEDDQQAVAVLMGGNAAHFEMLVDRFGALEVEAIKGEIAVRALEVVGAADAAVVLQNLAAVALRVSIASSNQWKLSNASDEGKEQPDE